MHVLMFYTVLHKIYIICSSVFKYLNSSVMKALERVFGHLFSLVFVPVGKPGQMVFHGFALA